MKILTILLAFLAFSCSDKVTNNEELILKYDKPAKIWEETLPLGNGRLGIMPDGNVEKEQIVLNDISMWSGSPENSLDEEAIHYLPKIRQLLLKSKNLEAQELMYKHFRCKGKGSAFGQGRNAPYGCFQTLGTLNIAYAFDDTTSTKGYNRNLNISTAKTFTNFTKGSVRYTREYFVSQNDDVIIIKLSADKKGKINFKLHLDREERASFFSKDGDLYMKGQLDDGYNGNKGVRFYTRVHIKNSGGQKTLSNNAISVNNANEAVIIISSGTDLLLPNYIQTVDNLIENAIKKPHEKIDIEHIRHYQEKFNRVTLDLKGTPDSIANLTIPERLLNFQKKKDPALAALYFQYGRYLMISGTREGSLPLNLQGLWANTTQTPWNGDYHLNINVQMNYWGAEVGNLSELHKPLLKFTTDLIPSGTKTAKNYYNADGWVAHVISNPWLFTAPGEHASWGATNTGGAWLCAHLWEHFAFTQDTMYLKSIFPTMKKASQFFLSTMLKEPKNGWLVTAPSSSPENAFYLPNSKQPSYVCMGPTMDAQIIRQLFQNTMKSAKILGQEDTIIDNLKKTLPLLPPTQISPNGYIQEWLEDYKEVDIHHRHISHLYGLYPAAQITPDKTPELAKAARVTLNRRGDEGTGWSRAWKINFWARLHDGDRAYKLLKNLLQPTFTSSYDYLHKGGTYPNLFCAHPPFQIDGNFGGAAGIAEMLLQSHEDYIEVLPALTKQWKTGSFKGLRVRGGGIIRAKWKDTKLTNITLEATATNSFKIKLPLNSTTIIVNGKEIPCKNSFANFDLKKGEKVHIQLSY